MGYKQGMNQDYENYNTADDDEVEIDLGKMFASVFRKTRQILASTIVLALVVGVCAYVTQYAKIKNQYSDENLAALEGNLTASEVQNVDTLYSRYKAYQSEINDSQTYMNKSLLMTMDSNNVTRENIGFLVTSNQSGIADFFSTYALGQEEYDKIAAVYGSDVDSDFISEVVSISTPDYDTESKIDSSQISIETANGDTIFDGGTITKGYSKLMNVSVIGPSKENCEQVSSLVQDAILAYAEKLKESGVTLTITKISEVYREGVYQWLADQQQAKIAANSDLVSTYNTFVTDNVSSLSDDQKNLFTFLQNRDDQKTTGISAAKYFAIGAAAGFLIALVAAIVSYLSGGRVRTIDDMLNLMLPYSSRKLGHTPEAIGFFHRGKKYRGLNRAIQHTADRIEFANTPGYGMEESAAAAITATRIQNIYQSLDEKGEPSLYLVQDCDDGFSAEVTQKLEEALQAKGIKAQCGDVSKDVKELEQMSQSNGTVIVCSLNNSRKAHLENSLRICRESGVPILGAVITAET